MTNPQPTSYSMAKITSVAISNSNKTGMSTFPIIIQHSTGHPSHSNQTRRRNKKHPNWKKRNKNFCRAKETINKMKTQPTKWKNVFTNDAFNKGLIFQNLVGKMAAT